MAVKSQLMLGKLKSLKHLGLVEQHLEALVWREWMDWPISPCILIRWEPSSDEVLL